MTTSYNYLAADRASVRAKINAQLATPYMTANLSTNWKGWRDITGTLDLGTAGTINAQSCGGIWDLQQTRAPWRVGDMEAPWARDYTLLIYLRRQRDPTDLAIVDAFDSLVKTRLKDAYVADSAGDFYDLSAQWALQDVGDSFFETVHVLRLRMDN